MITELHKILLVPHNDCFICCLDGACDDNNTNCPGWANSGECAANPGYMLKYCRKSCQVCVESKCNIF